MQVTSNSNCWFIHSLFLLTNLQFKLGHTPFKFQKLHVKCRFLTAHGRYLLLQAWILRLLMRVVPFHFLFNFKVFISERLAHFLGLQSQNALKSVLFGTKHLNLALVEVQFLSQLSDHVLYRYTTHISCVLGIKLVNSIEFKSRVSRIL